MNGIGISSIGIPVLCEENVVFTHYKDKQKYDESVSLSSMYDKQDIRVKVQYSRRVG